MSTTSRRHWEHGQSRTMKLFICLALCAFTAAQLNGLTDLLDQLRQQFQSGDGEGDIVDQLHGWRLEYHYGGDHHLLLFINNHVGTGGQNRRKCYIVEINPSWESLMQDKSNVEHITDELFNLLQDPQHSEQAITPIELGSTYHQYDTAMECRFHDTYKLDYTPSFA